LLLLAAAAAPAHADGVDQLIRGGNAGLDLRYRYESVDQADEAQTAAAHTLRLRLRLESGTVGGFSAFLEFDQLEALGGERHDDTRNGLGQYPVVADPEGGDWNQFWAQYRGAKDTLVRLGRQRIAFDKERFVGPVGWRQNEQTFDAVRLETGALPGVTLNYAYVDRVHRIFGPDAGTPPARLDSDSHLLNARLRSLPVGALTAYGYLLDFRNAPQLSSDTFGLRYEGERSIREGWRLAWALEYATQREAGGNAAEIDAHYGLAELKLHHGAVGLAAGYELLSGEAGTFLPSANPAFQTPLATLHPYQGWADKFTTTPSAGIEDLWLGIDASLEGWNARAVWHEFGAEATAQDYGTEWNLSLGRKFGDRYELLVKYASYDTDGLFADTDKFWIQFGAAFQARKP
jgi:hypothetical protein